jgi:hypothetical protein
MADLPYKVGDAVLYSPHLCHATAITAGGDACFDWHYIGQVGYRRSRQGRAAREAGAIVDLTSSGVFRREGGQVLTARGEPVEPKAARWYWPAWIVAIAPDGSVSLDVVHPASYRSMEDAKAFLCIPSGDAAKPQPRRRAAYIHRIPDWDEVQGGVKINADAPGLRYDPKAKAPHTFHLLQD